MATDAGKCKNQTNNTDLSSIAHWSRFLPGDNVSRN